MAAKEKVEIITTTEAIERVREFPTFSKTTRVSIITWCIKYGIGQKVFGRWKIDAKKLDLFIRGKV